MSVLYVGADADHLRAHFANVRAIGDIGDDTHVYLLTGLEQPWTGSGHSCAH